MVAPLGMRNEWEFVPVTRGSRFLTQVCDAVKARFSDLRDQVYELDKVQTFNNRHAEVILHRGFLSAILIFKDIAPTETIFSQVSVLTNEAGVREKLLERILEIAKTSLEVQIYFSTKEDSNFVFFQKQGFTLHEKEGREPLLFKLLPKEAPSRKRGREEALVAGMPREPAKAGLYELTLKPIYIHQIRERTKTIEGRIASGICSRFKVGDTVRFFYFQNQGDDVRCRIRAIRKYSGFDKMLACEGVKACLPNIASLEAAIGVYNAIPGYVDRAKASGVLAIELQVDS